MGEVRERLKDCAGSEDSAAHLFGEWKALRQAKQVDGAVVTEVRTCWDCARQEYR